MKKLAFLFVAVAAISFASCGNQTAEGEGNDTIDTTVTDTIATDTLASDSAATDTTATE